ncbi:hypothetical protein KR222_002787 [Zaprionus bogoriensis]|nr:hypothetical protein KR222_002787 [Zaprionus bogoriensis]
MFGKFTALCLLFALCSGSALVAGNRMDQFGIYGALDTSSTTTDRNLAAMRCVNVNPQHSVDLEQIMGLWYGSEIIVHSPDLPGVYEYDSCVIIHLTDVTQQVLESRRYNNNYGYRGQGPHQYQNNYRRSSTTPPYLDEGDELARQQQLLQQQRLRYLRLVWSERDNNVEYTFNYTTDAPGQWSNVGDQRGSLVALNTYTQFSGTVQVVKAVNDHLVLTFCGNDVKSNIYTVVLTRNRLGLSSDELRSIHSLLSRRGLYSENIRKVCSGAAGLGGGFFSHSLWLLFAPLLLLLAGAMGK